MTFIVDRPKRLTSFLATAGALLLCGCSQAAGIASSSTREIEVADPQYQMTAYTLAVPANWKFRGAIVRQSGPCHTTDDQLKYTMLAPDGTTAVITMPGVVWNWSADPYVVAAMVHQKCLPNDIHTAASFLVNIAVPIVHPQAKIISVLPLAPEVQASVAAQLNRLRQMGGNGVGRAGREMEHRRRPRAHRIYPERQGGRRTAAIHHRLQRNPEDSHAAAAILPVAALQCAHHLHRARTQRPSR
jgi:hypothetical protein